MRVDRTRASCPSRDDGVRGGTDAPRRSQPFRRRDPEGEPRAQSSPELQAGGLWHLAPQDGASARGVAQRTLGWTSLLDAVERLASDVRSPAQRGEQSAIATVQLGGGESAHVRVTAARSGVDVAIVASGAVACALVASVGALVGRLTARRVHVRSCRVTTRDRGVRQ